MKCPKCGYVSYEYLDACRKCSVDLIDFKKSLRLESVRPGDLDLSVMLVEQTEKLERAHAFDIDDDFFSAQTMLVEREESAEEDQDEFDISLDDFTEAAPRASSPADTTAEVTDSEDFISFEESEADDPSLRTLSTRSPMPSAAPAAPVDMIDMSDLEDLDDMRIDLDEIPEHPAPTMSEEDTLTMVRPPTPIAESPSDSESSDITFDLTEVDDDDAPPPSAALETVSETTTDDLLEAELELELEGGDAPKPAEPAADLLIHLDELDANDDEEEDRPKPS
jgi:hypothetical protein